MIDPTQREEAQQKWQPKRDTPISQCDHRCGGGGYPKRDEHQDDRPFDETEAAGGWGDDKEENAATIGRDQDTEERLREAVARAEEAGSEALREALARLEDAEARATRVTNELSEAERSLRAEDEEQGVGR